MQKMKDNPCHIFIDKNKQLVRLLNMDRIILFIRQGIFYFAALNCENQEEYFT